MGSGSTVSTVSAATISSGDSTTAELSTSAVGIGAASGRQAVNIAVDNISSRAARRQNDKFIVRLEYNYLFVKTYKDKIFFRFTLFADNQYFFVNLQTLFLYQQDLTMHANK